MKLEKIVAVRPSKVIYRDADRAIKVFDADYSKADVLNEALNQARVEETGLNIPKVKSCFSVADNTCMLSCSCATVKRLRKRPAVVSTALLAMYV